MTAGSATSNRACSACASGSYTATANQSSCSAWTNCGSNVIRTAGSSTADRVCCAANRVGSDCSYDITDFSMAYDLNIPATTVNWDTPADIPYATNNAASLTGYVARVAYLLELDDHYIWAEMDGFFTGGAANQTGVPVDWIYDRAVSKLTIRSNATTAVTEVTNDATGRVEFWSNCYGPGPGGVYDSDDDIQGTDCYGSMQVHRGTVTQLAFNRWSEALPSDLGIGPQVDGSGHPDWTFASNAPSFSRRRLRVFVRQARTCADLLQHVPGAADGTYTVDPDMNGTLHPFTVYCDMTQHGGGWTLIGRVGQGQWPELNLQEYTNLIANPTSDVNPSLLLTGAMPPDKTIAWFRRDRTNALYHATPYATQSAVRVIHDSIDNTADGSYFQQRRVTDAAWDFWVALRDARQWSSAPSGGTDVSNFGTDFVLTRSVSDFNSTTNTVTHSAAADGSFGWWDTGTLTLIDGSTLTVSRHGGLMNDGLENRGWLWVSTLNPSDSRFKNETPANLSRSTIWLR